MCNSVVLNVEPFQANVKLQSSGKSHKDDRKQAKVRKKYIETLYTQAGAGGYTRMENEGVKARHFVAHALRHTSNLQFHTPRQLPPHLEEVVVMSTKIHPESSVVLTLSQSRV